MFLIFFNKFNSKKHSPFEENKFRYALSSITVKAIPSNAQANVKEAKIVTARMFDESYSTVG